MVNKSKAHSTQPIDKENVEDLVKDRRSSKKWAPTAENLWQKSLENKN